MSLFINRIIPGVDETSYIKANFLNNICNDEIISPLIDKENAIKILGTMQGGYNTKILIDLLDDEEYGYIAYKQLSKMILIFDSIYDVKHKMNKGNIYAKMLMNDCIDATWLE